MKNNNQYLSEVAEKIIPYQWEETGLEKTWRFDANTPPFPPKSLPFFLKTMALNCPINEYADPSYTKLKKLIAGYEKAKPSMITVTNSGDEAIDILAKTFLNPGDFFITSPPTYEMFSIQCEINRGINLEVPLLLPDFSIDAEKIIDLANKNRVKIIFLCNPNNPTGTVIPPKVIGEIVKRSKSIVVVDEAYREFYGQSTTFFLQKYDNLVILRSFSKFAAIAGARVGYLISNRFLSQKFDGIRFPMGVSYFSYKLAETVLEKDGNWIKKQIKMIIKERERLTKELTDLGLYVYPSRTNFLLVKVGSGATLLCQKLKKKGFIIRDRSNKKYLDGCVRITVRSSEENRLLLKTIKEVI